MANHNQVDSEPFASAPLVALVVRALRGVDPAFLPPDAWEPDHLSSARFDSAEKTRILGHAYERGGVGPILQAAQQIGVLAALPAGQVLLRSRTTDVLAAKWMRLEKYHHATHRVTIDCSTARHWHCRRHWTTRRRSSKAEDLLVAGIMAALLRLVGCQDVRLRIAGMEFDEAGQSQRPVFVSGDTHAWDIRWRTEAFDTHRNRRDLRQVELTSMIRLEELLREDVGRVWKLDEAARELARSPRSLQRDIQMDGHTFKSVVRGIRIREAGRLLIETEMPIAEIGYWCGYADQAHFQRDFRRAVNMTPGQYREIALD